MEGCCTGKGQPRVKPGMRQRVDQHHFASICLAGRRRKKIEESISRGVGSWQDSIFTMQNPLKIALLRERTRFRLPPDEVLLNLVRNVANVRMSFTSQLGT